MAALTGFVVTVTVLVVQMVIGTFSARYMRLWWRDPVLKGTLALLAGTLAFSFSLLRRVETDFVPDIGVTVAGVLVAAGLVLFLLFFNRFVHRLRPVAVAEIAARQMQRSLRDDVALLADADDIFIAPAAGVDGQPVLAIRADRRGAIQAINFAAVARWARNHGCLAVIKHSIGDFVQVGDVFIEVYGDPGDAAEAERTLNGLVALGMERTIEQDPAFALRIMVDVANKALSAAINDPTTAVQVLNYIEDSLGAIGTTDVAEHSWRPGAAAGMVIPYRRWEDFLGLGVTEIREYGGNSIQVMRRMRAMLDRLSDEVLPERRAQVHDEIRRLDVTVAQSFKDSMTSTGPASLTYKALAAQGDWSQPLELGRSRHSYRRAGPVAVLRSPEPPRDLTGGELRPGRAGATHPATGDQGRIALLRSQLPPVVSPSRPPGSGDRRPARPPRLPLHRPEPCADTSVGIE